MIRLGQAAAAAFVMSACISWGSAQAQQSPVAHGDYIVNGILGCGNCHTPRVKGVLDNSRRHSGGPQLWDTPAYRVRGSNITPDPETGIGKWTDEQIARAVRDGHRADGTQLAPIMPSGFYKVLMPDDLSAIVAYLKSVKPVRNEVEGPTYRAAMSVHIPPGAEKPMTAADMKDPVRRGFYLVTIGHCMECHTPVVKGRQDFVNTLGQGGREFKGPWGATVASNITSHKERGLGAWSDDEIKRAIAKGVRRDGAKLRPPMGFEFYATMNDADLGAIVAYLRTVPARE